LCHVLDVGTGSYLGQHHAGDGVLELAHEFSEGRAVPHPRRLNPGCDLLPSCDGHP
jgi:hypothetical protein